MVICYSAITFSRDISSRLFFCYVPDVTYCSMGKVEDFSKVIKVVTELTEVTAQEILGKSRVQEVVDARWMVIYFMKMKGYCTKEISELVMHPERTVNHALQTIPQKMKLISSAFGNNILIARQQLL